MKKILLFIALFVLAVNTIPCYANNIDLPEFEFYSKEFPDAYIIASFDEETKLIGDTFHRKASATVFVEERYRVVEDQLVVTDSRLLSKSEVEAIGVENFYSLENDIITASDTESRGTLTIELEIQYSVNKNNMTVYTYGDANWSGFNFIYNSSLNPAVGEDFLGLPWGGNFDNSPYDYCTYTWNTGISHNAPLYDAIPNQSIVFSFLEFGQSSYSNPYVENAHLYSTLSKTLNGGGNTTGIVLKYIHTYQTVNGTISFSSGTNIFGADFTLSNTPQQWSICAICNGIPF